MRRTVPWLFLGALAAGGCLTTGGSFDTGDDDVVGDDDIVGDGDADADGDADSDADADSDSDVGCPAYPEGPYGFQVGDVVQNLGLAGNGPDNAWYMEDFWCMAHEAESPATVVMLNVHSMT